ncbi:MAG: hypothetical protein H6850_03450 [Alphaproteobacteria bacterium]|nr:MAG: hypothetical protein H6850_03450 [Alphaproteobacteria bacterium]
MFNFFFAQVFLNASDFQLESVMTSPQFNAHQWDSEAFAMLTPLKEQKIQQAMGELKKCYEQQLKDDASEASSQELDRYDISATFIQNYNELEIALEAVRRCSGLNANKIECLKRQALNFALTKNKTVTFQENKAEGMRRRKDASHKEGGSIQRSRVINGVEVVEVGMPSQQRDSSQEKMKTTIQHTEPFKESFYEWFCTRIGTPILFLNIFLAFWALTSYTMDTWPFAEAKPSSASLYAANRSQPVFDFDPLFPSTTSVSIGISTAGPETPETTNFTTATDPSSTHPEVISSDGAAHHPISCSRALSVLKASPQLMDDIRHLLESEKDCELHTYMKDYLREYARALAGLTFVVYWDSKLHAYDMACGSYTRFPKMRNNRQTTIPELNQKCVWVPGHIPQNIRANAVLSIAFPSTNANALKRNLAVFMPFRVLHKKVKFVQEIALTSTTPEPTIATVVTQPTPGTTVKVTTSTTTKPTDPSSTIGTTTTPPLVTTETTSTTTTVTSTTITTTVTPETTTTVIETTVTTTTTLMTPPPTTTQLDPCMRYEAFLGDNSNAQGFLPSLCNATKWELENRPLGNLSGVVVQGICYLNLTRLTLLNVGLTQPDMLNLLKCPNAGTLTYLDVSENNFGPFPGLARAIMESIGDTILSLWIWDNKLGDDTVLEVVRALNATMKAFGSNKVYIAEGNNINDTTDREITDTGYVG